MKKLALVLALCMICGLCSACSTVEADNVDPSSDVSSVFNSELPEETPEPSEEPKTFVPFTQEMYEQMTELMKENAYISFIQTMENGVTGTATYAQTIYGVTANATQGVSRISMKYIQSNGSDKEGVGYEIMSDGDIVIVKENDEWHEADGTYQTIAWDMSQFESSWDIFEYLLQDIPFPVERMGYYSDEYFYVDYEEPATADLLYGLEYTTLGDAQYSFIFAPSGETLRPMAMTLRVDYELGDVAYYVQSNIQVSGIGNTEIEFPSVERTYQTNG